MTESKQSQSRVLLPRFIAEQAKCLEYAGIESAKAEVEWILCHVLDVDRLNLYLHGEELLDEQARKRVDEMVVRRTERYPLQFILNESWFYGRKFFVSPAVMAPTPETERLCEAALSNISSRELQQPKVLDIGTGSGVLAMAMCQAGLPSCRAYEIDPVSIHEAKKNIALNHLAKKN